MLTDVLAEIYERDLAKLKSEIEAYTDAADLWAKEGDVPNSAGNLALHLIGNLKHFIGAVLGNTGYVRDRDAEFSSTDVAREEIVAAIDETRSVVAETLPALDADTLTRDYPIEVLGRTVTTEFFLIHLAGHLNYHLGQINYHRRLLAKQFKGEMPHTFH